MTGLDSFSIYVVATKAAKNHIKRMACTRKVSGKGNASQNHCGTQISMSRVTTVETMKSSQVVEVEVFSVFIVLLNFFVRQK